MAIRPLTIEIHGRQEKISSWEHIWKFDDVIKFKGAPNMAAISGALAYYRGHYIGTGDSTIYINLEWIRNDKSKGQGNGGYDENDFYKKAIKITWKNRMGGIER